MFSRIAVCTIVGIFALTGCQTPYKEKDEQDRAERRGEKIKDQSGDTSFQAFLGRLRIAADRKDRVTLSTMMVPMTHFGWRWDPHPAEETAFDYWDRNNSWPILQTTLKESFVPYEKHMVAFASDPAYEGYRVGIRMDKGSWKFAYFVGPSSDEAGQ